MVTFRRVAWVSQTLLLLLTSCTAQIQEPLGRPDLSQPAAYYGDHPIACRPPFSPIDEDYRNLQCGLLEVPLDHHDPSAGKGRIYYTRYPASPNVARKGTIFLDPGYYPFATDVMGPVDPQTWLHNKGGTLHDRTLGEFDIVVWHARGKGSLQNSLTVPGPVRCFDSTTERNAFYARTAAALGFSPSWNDDLEYTAPQDDQDIVQWHAVQEKVVEHCLARTNQTMLQYVGTAATARDVVAMADAFDGPGSSIYFWGMGHGSLVGRYLLELFPERVGRVVLDDPLDPGLYSRGDPYERWKIDISSAQGSLDDFQRSCIRDKINGCQTVHDEHKSSFHIANFANFAIGLARDAFVGWKTQLNVDERNGAYGRFLEAIYDNTNTPYDVFPNSIAHDAAIMRGLSGSADETLGLGLMPISCGDLALKHDSETMRKLARNMPGVLLSSKSDAPLLMHAVVPSMQYMCHLWPIRATETLSTFELPNEDIINILSNRILVTSNMMNSMGPRVYPPAQLSLAEIHDRDHDISKLVTQYQFGIPSVFHSRCMNEQILRFLQHGTGPTTSRCFGNGYKHVGASTAAGQNRTAYDSESVAPVTAPLLDPPSLRYPPIQSCRVTDRSYPSGWFTTSAASEYDGASNDVFYVKVLWARDRPEKRPDGALDIQSGDVIAVTQASSKPGWWTGAIVDEARGQPQRIGKFPSNRVCLL